MKHFAQTKAKFVVLFLLSVLIAASVQSQRINLTGVLDGSKGQIAVDSSVTVTDTLYYSSTFASKLIKPYYVKNVITLRLNEQSTKYIAGPITAIVNVVISYKTESGDIDSTNASLNLSYKADSSYLARTSFIFSGAHSVKVRISSLVNADSLKPVLLLENEMIPYRQYTFDCAVSVPSPLTILDTTGDQLTVGWPNVFGTDEADLEWTYIDTNAFKNFKKAGNVWDTAAIFKNNATRITIAAYNYKIPLLFPDTGALFVRIRPVQYRGQMRITGKWSSEYLTNGLLVFYFHGHESNLNWQSDISFAEEGKRKAVVQYYDGTLRQRQTVTRDQSTSTITVSETMYDYQGRPTIQVMPAPTLTNIIKYSKNFNIGINSAEYDKTKYDVLNSSVGYCDQAAAPMDSTTGASAYYSSTQQSALGGGVNKYIPDAFGYPFTETEYTPDNTGRIKRQSGVGPTFKLGSHHETKYYYAITPDQNELDALFGTDAGDKSHYFKNAVQDANGQVSVSYADMHGRTIATALSGDALADGATSSLINLDSNTPSTITETIADATTNVTKGTIMESHKSLLVTKSGVNTFHYTLSPKILTLPDCNAANVCYECLYDLTITITDDCNNHNLPNDKPYIVQIKNFKFDSITNSCSGHNIDTTFSLSLDIGNYEITKILSLSKPAEDFYRDSIFVKRNTCKSFADFIIEQRALLPQTSECNITCSSCLASVGTYESFKESYISNVLGGQDSTLYVQNIHDAYNDALASCDRYCEIETVATNSVRDNMLLDVSPPSGQYASSTTTDQYSIFYFGTGSYLFQSLSNYKDENGKLDTVFSPSTNTYKLPQQLTQTEFVAQFKPSWANSLIALHPEYCKLTDYETHLDTYNWNTRAQSKKTYAEAQTAGFTNPFSNPEKDPLTNDTHYYSRLYQAYNYYDTINILGTDYPLSMWDFAKLLVKCPTGERDCTYDYVVSNNRSLSCAGDSNMAWNNFIGLYIRTKNNLLNAHYDSLGCNTIYNSNIHSQDLLNASHTLNFLTATIAISGSGLEAFNNADSAALAHSADSARKDAYTQVCNSYKSTWTKQLTPGYGGNPAYIPQIEAQLVAVCIAGSGTYHPLGSRDISNETPSIIDGSYTYRSFDDVINTFNTAHSIQKDAWHNADILTLPAPYYNALSVNVPLDGKPDSLQCDKINTYYNEYLVYRLSPSETFSQYLSRTANTQISDADLTDLMNSCSASGTCTYLNHPITLPAIFLPFSGQTCINCSVANSLYAQFIDTYNGQYVPEVASQNDTAQQQVNILFANYMNNKLGFNLNAIDYLNFLEQCNEGAAAASLQNATHVQANLSLSAECGNWAKFTGYQPGVKIGDLDISGNQLTIEALFNRNTEYYFPPYYNPGDVVSKHNDGTDDNYLLRLSQASVTTTTGFHLVNPACNVEINKTYHIAMVYDGQYLRFYRNGFLMAQDTCTGNLILNDWLTTIGSTAGPNSEYYNPSNMYGYINEVKIWNVARTQNQIRQYMNTSLPNPTTQTGLLAYYIFDSLNNKQGNASWNGTLQYNAVINQTNPQCTLVIDSCGYDLTAMDGPMLCNKPLSSLPPPALEPVNNCTDSTYYITVAATNRFNYYKDSLNDVFDSLYHAKCMQAYNFESFTVVHTVSEYHYTLYYYDQAGNLVQTVPPQAAKPNWNTTYLGQVKTKRAAKDTLRPGHNLVLATRYLYNSLNQVVTQKTPDAKTSDFYYDRLGRLVVSQNRKQNLVNKYSYTNYDYIGRIKEVGELTSSTSITTTISKSPSQLNTWLTNAASTRTQITQTVYDNEYLPFVGIPLPQHAPLIQRNLRNRVSFVKLYNNATDQTNINHATATYYSYDIHGNVDTLVQDFKAGNMTATNNRYKKIVYDYDLISGKVNSVAYQPNRTDSLADYNTDAFYQRYTYDDENRLVNVETSTDSIYWENEAFYKYYKHGPLARTVLGEQKVQGIDYAYTLQGWLKGVNTTALATPYDMGIDGQPAASATNATIARDVFGFALYYYGLNDYRSANINAQPFADVGTPLGSSFKPLYNGNISAMAEAITPFTKALTYNYRYDQLNRLVQMRSYRNTATNSNVLQPVAVNDFSEDVQYDANGNILKYKRYANSSNANLTNAAVMDSLTYNYNASTNQLNYIRDQIAANSFSVDIDNQPANNYRYDSIGNLIKDSTEGISSIEWTVYGKISKVTKTNGTVVNYTYDAAGNRISKIITGAGAGNGETWYVRDASGNIMSTYEIATQSGVTYATWGEADIYGSSRLATYNPKFDMRDGRPELVNVPRIGTIAYYYNFSRGKKLFELTNHLGNVLATITDTKIPVRSGSSISYYTANIINATEYHPFGMRMRGRDTMLLPYYNSYRYGFNGQEKSTELNSNLYTAEFWEYDSRSGRRWNVDPRPNTSISPYNCFAGNPIFQSDPLGDTTLYYSMKGNFLGGIYNDGEVSRIKVNEKILNKVGRQLSQQMGVKEKFETQQQRNDYVTALNSRLDNLEATGKYGDLISRETGVQNLTFTGSYSDMTHLASGTLSLNSMFDNGSSLSINQWEALSGTVAKGGKILYPLPNRNDYTGTGIEPRSAKGFVNHGVGYVLMINDFPVTTTWNRGLFRIHPDGNSPGSAGCIALQSGKDGLLLFKSLMQGYTRAHGNINIQVNIASNPNIGYIEENEKGQKKVNYGE